MVDFLITYDLNTGEYLFYSNNDLYQKVGINGVLNCPILPASFEYIACGEDETVVDPTTTYYIYVYNEEIEDYEYQIVENPSGSPYEQGYFTKTVEVVHSLVDTSTKSYLKELQPDDFRYDSEHDYWVAQWTPEIDTNIQRFIITSVTSEAETAITTIENSFSLLILEEQPTQLVRYQIFYTDSIVLVKDEDYLITLYTTQDQSTVEILSCVDIIDGFLCLGDYETYLGYTSGEPEPEPETPEVITVKQIDEELYAAEIEYPIEHFDEEKITYRYKVLFGRAPNTEEYILDSQYYIDELGFEVAYIGNLHIINESAEPIDIDFLITTVNGTSTLYVTEAGEYNLFITLFNLMEVPSLVGGSLTSLGNRELDEYVLTEDIEVIEGKTYYELIAGEYIVVVNPTGNPSEQEWYELVQKATTDNYGIGINSSDTAMGLPAKAISLFETNIRPDNSIKVSYIQRGILGTLPGLRYVHPGETDPQVAKLYEDYMKGTQGIYTDNMYIGDATQYLAFYTKNGRKRLDVTGGIHALSLTIGEGSNAYDGAAAIDSMGYSLGIVIVEDDNLDNGVVYLYPHLYYNGTDVTDTKVTDYTKFIWYRDNSTTPITGQGGTGKGRIEASEDSRYRVTYFISYEEE